MRTIERAVPIAMTAALLAGCPDPEPVEPEPGTIETRVAELEATVIELQGTVADLEAQLAEQQGADGERLTALEDDVEGVLATTASMAELTQYVSVDTGGNVVFSGTNVLVHSGSGATDDGGAPLGLGNLVIGYDESAGGEARGGSHNLVVGPYHAYDGVGGLVAGISNAVLADHGAIVGGSFNTASGGHAAVCGGSENVASGEAAVVCGGRYNEAAGFVTTVAGECSQTVAEICAYAP